MNAVLKQQCIQRYGCATSVSTIQWQSLLDIQISGGCDD